MRCTGCGSKLERKALFCGICGTKSTKKGFCKTKQIILFIIAIIVIGVLVLLGLKFKNNILVSTSSIEKESVEKKSPAPRSSRENLIVFEDYDDLFYVIVGKNKPYILNETRSDIYDDSIMASQNGKKVYSVDYDENLYLNEDGKEAIEIGKNVDGFMISSSGDTLVYYEYEDDENSGVYVWSSNTGAVKISTSETVVISTINISENGKYVAFTEESHDHDEGYKSYLYPIGSEKIQCQAQLVLGVNNKGSIIGTDLFGDENLMMTDIGKEAEIIAQDLLQFIGNSDFSKLVVEEKGGGTYIWNSRTKEKKEVLSNNGMSLEILEAKGTTNNPRLETVKYTNTQELDVTFRDDYGDVYLMLDGYKPEAIVPAYASDMVISDDYRTIAYIEDGSLYIKRFINNQLKVEGKIDDYVDEIKMDKTGKHLAYMKDWDIYYLPPGKKEGFKIAEDVDDFKILENGLIYYEKDGTLYVAQGEKGSEKIAEDVDEWVANNEGVYFIDNHENLYKKAINREAEKIGSDVYGVMEPENQELQWYMW